MERRAPTFGCFAVAAAIFELLAQEVRQGPRRAKAGMRALSDLFGNFTPQPPSEHLNGYAALAVYDLNHDGVIDAQDPIYTSLRIWIDSNHDGVSQPEELHTLAELRVHSTSLHYRESRMTDQYGNRFRYTAAADIDNAGRQDRFFGDGAINLELLAKRRSELWILLKDDIGVVRKGGHRQVVTQSDVQVVNVGGGGQNQPQPQPGRSPSRILQIVDEHGATGLAGFYIRLPDTAFSAYGDLLPECEGRGVVWAGNKIMYVASDAVSAAFQYEIRLDELVAATLNGQVRAEGALQLERPLQEMYNGIYFPIPEPLARFLVPQGNAEIRLELHCDWIDTRTAKHWAPREEG